MSSSQYDPHALFEASQAWASRAEQVGSNNPPTLAPLIEHLTQRPGVKVLRPRPDVETLRDHLGRELHACDIRGTSDIIGTRTRFFLPVHLVTGMAVDQVPGFVCLMQDETVGSDNKSGRTRLPHERIYRAYIHLPKRTIKDATGAPIKLKGRRVSLPKVLFETSLNSRLHERRTGDHHRIVPNGYLLTEVRTETAPAGRSDVLYHARCILEATPAGSLPYNASEMMGLLHRLFAICDRWHWDEVLERLETDKRPGSEY